MEWLILRTDARKEQYVAAQVRNLGFDAWVPVQIIIRRDKAARRHMDRSNEAEHMKRPVCPCLLFGAVPVDAVDQIVGIRHLSKIVQTSEGRIATVPDAQISVFMKAIDAENALARILTAAQRRKRKKEWMKLQDGLLSLAENPSDQVSEAA